MYRVYGKKKTDKRMKPFDMKTSRFVVNLIFCSVFAEKAPLQKEVDFMNSKNPDYTFEVRAISG